MMVAYSVMPWMTGREPERVRTDIEQAFRECKYLGYDGVECFSSIVGFFAENPQELVVMQNKHGVEIVSLYGILKDASAYETLAAAKRQVEFLADIGGKWYNYQNPLFVDGGAQMRPTNPETVKGMCCVANELGEYAQGLGVSTCLHPHYGTCVCSQDDIDCFMEHTDPACVFLCVDTAHSVLGDVDSAELIHRHGKRVKFMHLQDIDSYALGKLDDGDIMSTYRPLGHGTVNFTAIKAALDEAGYDGVMCAELGRNAICAHDSAKISRVYLKNVLKL